ncbi:MAG: type II toxin-antitoxin system RelE/ParE family toxin [Sneathiella sp.]|nr:type II toxin-antitoxin system RelE/ParE family toxin [Sneathiella sp.]
MAAYKLSEDAAKTIENIYSYSLLNFGEEKADDYYLSLHNTFELLADQPNLGREFHEFHRHEHGHHIFFYKITNYGILILHVLHQKENIKNKLQ